MAGLLSGTKLLTGRGMLSGSGLISLTQAQKDGAVYRALLASNGKTLADADYQQLVAYAAALYTTAGKRVDFISLRSSQNMGTGSTAYSWLGAPCTLVNGPTWGTDGITFTQASSHYISTLLDQPSGIASFNCVFKATATAAFQGVMGYEGDSLVIARNDSNPQFGVVIPGIAIRVNQAINNAEAVYFSAEGSSLAGGLSVKSAKNDGAVLADVFPSRPSNATGKLSFGRQTASGPYFSGLISFGIWGLPAMTQAGNTTLFNAYKSTIGAGLGLP